MEDDPQWRKDDSQWLKDDPQWLKDDPQFPFHFFLRYVRSCHGQSGERRCFRYSSRRSSRPRHRSGARATRRNDSATRRSNCAGRTFAAPQPTTATTTTTFGCGNDALAIDAAAPATTASGFGFTVRRSRKFAANVVGRGPSSRTRLRRTHASPEQ